jgi:tetratricopeptide (TPR) repeat protein
MDQITLSEIDSLTDKAFLSCFTDLARAQRLAEECSARAEQSDYRSGVINARIIIGCIEIYLGRLDQARDRMSWIEEALVSQASPDDSLMRYTYLRAVYFMRVRNYRDSFDLLIRTGVLAARLGNLLYQCLSEIGKGSIKLEQLEYEEAFEYFNTAGTFLTSPENEILSSLIRLKTGCTLYGLKRSEEAERALQLVIDKSRAEEWNVLECSALEKLGEIWIDQNIKSQAWMYIREGLDKSGNLKGSDIHMRLINLKARLLFMEGESLQAEKLLNDSASENI